MRISDWSSDVCSSDLKIERGALSFLDVEFPLVMCFDRIDRQTDGFHVALVPFGTKFCHFAKLGRTDRREILGMTEQHPPAWAQPVVKADATLGAVLFEIGGNMPELDGHGDSFVTLTAM